MAWDAGRRAHVKPATKRVLFWLFIIFVVFMIANEPDQSADWVHQGFDWIAQAFDGLFDFFDALVS
jgi:cell shape-determining protein MreC